MEKNFNVLEGDFFYQNFSEGKQKLMLVDVRTYRCAPGTINAHLALYDEFGREPQYRCLGEPLAFLKGETGDPNEFVHIWVYENAGDREQKRATLWSDPEWLSYTKQSAELGALERQENKLMTPTSFSPSLINS